MNVKYRKLILVVALVATVGLIGCPPPHQEEELTAHIEVVPEAPATLEEVTIEVHIENAAGNHVMDMEEVHLEYQSAGSDTWREIDLTAHEDHYVGTRTFTGSGDYALRIMGMSHGGHESEEMASMTLAVSRAHVDAGPYHIQYESDPGHIHEGDTAILTFWIALEETGAAVTGLDAQISVEESDGHISTPVTQEGTEDGVYWAEMLLADPGEAHIKIEFTGADSSTVSADFHINVSAVH